MVIVHICIGGVIQINRIKQIALIATVVLERMHFLFVLAIGLYSYAVDDLVIRCIDQGSIVDLTFHFKHRIVVRTCAVFEIRKILLFIQSSVSIRLHVIAARKLERVINARVR